MDSADVISVFGLRSVEPGLLVRLESRRGSQRWERREDEEPEEERLVDMDPSVAELSREDSSFDCTSLVRVREPREKHSK